mmetsp:Transcript_18490/g.37534  ORF Transcript_18490/g.37534 Transcript_18490/m.37534 type:complete len:240 (-) Transcript_18490:729-1448(-)
MMGAAPALLKERIAERRERLEADEVKLKKQEKESRKMKDEVAARSASAQPAWGSDDESNEYDSEYSCVQWDPTAPASIPILTCTATLSFDTLDDACLDSGSQVNITPHLEHVLEYEDGEVDVKGVHGGTKRARRIRMGLPTVSTNGTPLLMHVPGPSLHMPDSNSLIVAYGPLKRAGYKWKEGNSADPTDGGYLRTPDGERIALRRENDLWHLPVFATPTHAARPCTLSKTPPIGSRRG